MHEERFRLRNLPHWELDGATYFITVRLAGSLPAPIAEEWREERERIRCDGAALEPLEARVLCARFDAQLDRGETGPLHLRVPEVAGAVVEALQYHRGLRYDLPAYVVMPNHVHLLLRPLEREETGSCWRLDELMHSIKSYSAKQANRILGRAGPFWQREYYDHLIRDEDERCWYADYILHNPVAAGFCSEPEAWPWSNARAVYGSDDPS